jgi:hypothetical protein
MISKALDITTEKPSIPSAVELTTLVSRVSNVLATDADLKQKWAEEALAWAISCPSVHLIARSYQIYRSLKSAITREALVDVLRALWKCISDPLEPENFGLGLEILYTLQVMVQELDSNKLILFTQIFWGGMALLYTDYEQHFVEATNLLSKLIARLDFTDRSVQNVFRASIPDWDVPFLGVQPLVLKGLLSPVTEPHAIRLLSQITLLPCDGIFQLQPGRFETNMVSLILCEYLTRIGRTLAVPMSAHQRRQFSLLSAGCLYSLPSLHKPKSSSLVQDIP